MDTPSAPSARQARGWSGWWLLFLLLVVAGLGVAVWWFWPRRQVDWDAVLTANNRGVGLMEQYNYKDAVTAFEEVVQLDPNWVPGRINLGIALLNTATEANLKRARELFNGILQKEPDNPHANFCLGIMSQYEKDPEVAIKHFKAVLHKDPNDAASWCWVAQLTEGEEQAECFRRAYTLDPALTPAVYGMAQLLLRQDKRAQAMELLERHKALDRSGTGVPLAVKYSEMGHYADVIGRRLEPLPPHIGPLPLFAPRDLKVDLAPGARWAAAADFGKDAVGQVCARVRARFGGAVAVLDFNGDGKPDLFLASAVVEKGQVRDLLLRNDGEGKFSDVTAAAGLDKPHPTLGCCVADFDNDGKPDLLLTGAGSQKLFRNKGDGTFKDVSAKAGLEKVGSVCLGSAFVDLDQDADLDMLIAEYAPTAEEALKALDGKEAAGGKLLVFLNTGESPPANPGEAPKPLSGKFTRRDDLPNLSGPPAPVVGVAVSDLNGDGALDLAVLSDRQTPAVVFNERLLRFRRQVLPDNIIPPAAWNGALVHDADHDGRFDLFLVAVGQPARLLLNRITSGSTDPAKWFEAGPCNAPALLQAMAADVDLDGWMDVVALSAERLPVLLHNEGGRLALARDAFGLQGDWPKDLVAAVVCDLNNDDYPDLLTWSEAKGLQLHESKGNGNHALRLQVTGRNLVEGTGNHLRCNTDGIGTRVIAQKGTLWTDQENTTLSAGLGQSRQPLVLGLGKATSADVVRLRWPDGCWQAELDVHAERLVRIEESNKKMTSCPVLFAWDGKRFVFVTDFLGAGSMGELGPDRTCRPPRPEESVKIEPGLLAAQDGFLVLKIAEPMSEISYLDKLQLAVIDHPAAARIYPDERFAASGPPPSQNLIAFDREIFPLAARDHRGRDVTDMLRRWDRVTVDGFACRSWIGFAEEHSVELDFGDRLAGFRPDEKHYLCLAGWTDYAYPESIWAAHQAGIEMQVPVLERLAEDGRWRSLGEAGFPAGLPRMILLDVTGKLGGPRCRLRLRTNLHVFWDQIFVAAGCRVVQPGAALEVASAVLEPCGVMQEYSPDGRQPTLYDHDRSDSSPLTPPAGKRTRFGDVTELLRDKDDRFVVFGPGDGLTVRFEAARLPPLPAGWQRSFVLRTWGYCKDTAPFTARGETIEPLPFATMRNYPPGPEDREPDRAEYRRRYQTREVGTPMSSGGRR
jgi:cytochrome c-type biogenesis protein CcmH/NrfG